MRLKEFLGVIAVFSGAALLCSCGDAEKDGRATQGYVEAEYVYLASPFGGHLKSLKTVRGAQVAKGETLVELESVEEDALRASAAALLAQAKATLEDMRKGKRPEEIAALEEVWRQAKAVKELADVEFQRSEKLVKYNVIPIREYDQTNYNHIESVAKLAEAAMNLNVAKLGSRVDQIRSWEAYCDALAAKLAGEEWRRGWKTLAAPAAGRVFDTFYREGEYVPAGKAALALLPPGNVKIRFFVGERQAAALKPGDEALYAADGQPFRSAVVDYISPQVEYTPPVIYSRENRGKLVVMVEARPKPEDAAALNVGLPVDVKLPEGAAR